MSSHTSWTWDEDRTLAQSLFALGSYIRAVHTRHLHKSLACYPKHDGMALTSAMARNSSRVRRPCTSMASSTLDTTLPLSSWSACTQHQIPLKQPKSTTKHSAWECQQLAACLDTALDKEAAEMHDFGAVAAMLALS